MLLSQYTILRQVSSMRLIDLPVGTTFYVVNGDWRGEVVLDKDFDKVIKVLPNHTRRMSYGISIDPTEIKVLQSQQYKKITENDNLELSDIKYPVDSGIVPDSNKEYFDYLMSIV